MPQRRISVAQHRAAGTYRKDRHGSRNEPAGIPTLPPAPPENLTPGARDEWQRVIQLMGSSGQLTALDATALRAYCELTAELAEDPRSFNASRHTALRLLAGELGLTPHGRNRLPEPQKPMDDALSRWAAIDAGQ